MIKIYTLTFWISFKGFKGTLLILRIQWYFGRLKVSMGIVVVLGAFWSFFKVLGYFGLSWGILAVRGCRYRDFILFIVFFYILVILTVKTIFLM